jgi:hypothetical protein
MVNIDFVLMQLVTVLQKIRLADGLLEFTVYCTVDMDNGGMRVAQCLARPLLRVGWVGYLMNILL